MSGRNLSVYLHESDDEGEGSGDHTSFSHKLRARGLHGVLARSCHDGVAHVVPQSSATMIPDLVSATQQRDDSAPLSRASSQCNTFAFTGRKKRPPVNLSLQGRGAGKRRKGSRAECIPSEDQLTSSAQRQPWHQNKVLSFDSHLHEKQEVSSLWRRDCAESDSEEGDTAKQMKRDLAEALADSDSSDGDLEVKPISYRQARSIPSEAEAVETLKPSTGVAAVRVYGKAARADGRKRERESESVSDDLGVESCEATSVKRRRGEKIGIREEEEGVETGEVGENGAVVTMVRRLQVHAPAYTLDVAVEQEKGARLLLKEILDQQDIRRELMGCAASLEIAFKFIITPLHKPYTKERAVKKKKSAVTSSPLAAEELSSLVHARLRAWQAALAMLLLEDHAQVLARFSTPLFLQLTDLVGKCLLSRESDQPNTNKKSSSKSNSRRTDGVQQSTPSPSKPMNVITYGRRSRAGSSFTSSRSEEMTSAPEQDMFLRKTQQDKLQSRKRRDATRQFLYRALELCNDKRCGRRQLQVQMEAYREFATLFAVSALRTASWSTRRLLVSVSEHWSAPSLVLFLDETIASYVRCARLKIMEEEQKKMTSLQLVDFLYIIESTASANSTFRATLMKAHLPAAVQRVVRMCVIDLTPVKRTRSFTRSIGTSKSLLQRTVSDAPESLSMLGGGSASKSLAVKCRSEGDGIGVDGECEDDKRGGSKEDDAINPAGEVLVGALRALVNFSNHCAATYFTESVLKVICCIFALDIPGPYRFDAKVLALGNLLNVLESDLSKGNLFRLAMVDEAARLLPNTEKSALEMFVRLLFSQISVDCASVLPRRERSQLSGRELEMFSQVQKGTRHIIASYIVMLLCLLGMASEENSSLIQSIVESERASCSTEAKKALVSEIPILLKETSERVEAVMLSHKDTSLRSDSRNGGDDGGDGDDFREYEAVRAQKDQQLHEIINGITRYFAYSW